MSVLRLLHFLGMAMWFGGALAAMIIVVNVRQKEWTVRAVVYPLLAKVHVVVVGPGALLTVVTGLLMMGVLVTGGMGEMMGRPSIIVMQTAGIVAGLIALLGGMPTAQAAARAASQDETPDNVSLLARLGKRQAMVSSTAGVLYLVALGGVVLLP